MPKEEATPSCLNCRLLQRAAVEEVRSCSPCGTRPPEQFSPLFDSLFFRESGDIAVNSSAPGEYAVSGWKGKGYGSLFSQTFLKVVANSDRATTWENTLKTIRRSVHAEFSDLKERYRRDVALLGGRFLADQDSQTVWAIRDKEIWIDY